MKNVLLGDVSRRSFFAALGAFGAAAMVAPRAALSQDGKVLTLRGCDSRMVHLLIP